MLKCLKNADWKKTGIFAAGVAFGTAGIKALSSNDAKKFYTNVTAADRKSTRLNSSHTDSSRMPSSA